ESTNVKNFQECGYKLDSSRERELESQCNELLLETEFFANKCSEFRNAKALAEARSDKSDTISEELAWPRSVITGGDEENKSITNEICSEVSDTEISRVEDPLQCNKDSTISPNETYPQILIEETETIPAVVKLKTHYSTIGALESPLIALLLLALLIIIT
ncbi:6343_t:CDS:2, partial [Gigaspora margarita]